MLRVTQKMYADACAVGPKAAHMHLQQIDPELVTTCSVRKWYPLCSVLGVIPRKYFFAGVELLRLAADDGSPQYGPEDKTSDTALEKYLNTLPGGEERIALVRQQFLRSLAVSLRSSALWVNTEALRLQILRENSMLEFVMTGDESVLPQSGDEWRFTALRFALLHSPEELEIDETEVFA